MHFQLDMFAFECVAFRSGFETKNDTNDMSCNHNEIWLNWIKRMAEQEKIATRYHVQKLANCTAPQPKPKLVIFLYRQRGEAWIFRVHSPRRSRGECTRNIQCLSDLSVKEYHSFQFWNNKKPKIESSSLLTGKKGSWFSSHFVVQSADSFLLPT